MLEDTRSEPPLFVATESRPEPGILDDRSEEIEPSVRRQLFFGYSA